MRFYTVSEDYLAFLQQHDASVPNSAGAGYKVKKPFVGVVLEIGTHKFIAPLTSYKESQDKIDNSNCTAFKLHERTNPDNKLGMIALRFMIPVLDSEIAELDVKNQDQKYQKMLHMQYEFIKTTDAEIKERAAKLYEHVVIKRTPFYVKISCKIPTLVDEYRNYKSNKAEGSPVEGAAAEAVDTTKN